MDAGENVVYIILRQHDLGDFPVILRLILPHPENLGGSEAGEGNVRRQGGQLVLADCLIQVVHLLGGSAVVPENRGTNYIIILVQHHQTVHLAAAADTGNLPAVEARKQLRDSLHNGLAPVLWILLAPAGLGEFQGILPGNHIFDFSLRIHQQQLDGGGAQVYTNV